MKTSFKAQMSIFIIISIIIVIIGLVVFSLNSDSVKFFSDEKSSYKVKEFVESCLDLQVKEAQQELGLHGGWLYSPYSNLNYADRNTQEFLVKNSRGINFFRNNIAYWFYYDDSSEEFKTFIPEFDTDNKYSIRNQIKTYVDETLERKCLKQFESFEHLYEIEYNSEEIDVIIEFKDEDILTSLELPLKIHEINQNSSEFIDFFKVEQYNKVKVPYYMSKDIVQAEINSSFIEKRMLSFLQPYMDSKRRDLLPPTYDFRLVFDYKPWDLKESKTLAKQIISSNINLIQFSNSKVSQNYQIPKELKDNAFAQGVYKMYEKDYLSENSMVKESNPELFSKFKAYSVNPMFEVFFPMTFRVSPSFGNIILLPEVQIFPGGGIIPIFTTLYQASYEITNPVLFEIKDARNKNDNFVFNLAIETNIAHNAPLKENDPNLIRLGQELHSSMQNEEEISSSLMCDPPQFISKFVSLDIVDRINYGNLKGERGEPRIGVDDALVSFSCKGFSNKCYIGMTDINGETPQNNITRLKFRLPIDCDPGTLEISKFGHKTLRFDNLDPNLVSEINLGEVIMDSQKALKLRIKVVEESHSKYSTGRSVKDYETGFLIFTHKDDSNIVSAVEFNRDNLKNLNISLMPGEYNVEGYLIAEKDILIPADEICYEAVDGVVDALFGGSTECFTIPEMEMESWLTGGIAIESFEVDYKKLLTADEIEVSLIDFGLPSSYDDLTTSSNSMSDLKEISITKKPVFG